MCFLPFFLGFSLYGTQSGMIAIISNDSYEQHDGGGAECVSLEKEAADLFNAFNEWMDRVNTGIPPSLSLFDFFRGTGTEEDQEDIIMSKKRSPMRHKICVEKRHYGVVPSGVS